MNPIILYHGSQRTVLFRFKKETVYVNEPFFSRFDEKKISWTCSGTVASRYKSAISLVKELYDNWAFHIDWGRVKMASPKESFSIVISYAGRKKIEVPVIVNVQLKEISVNDLSITIDNQTGQWGKTGILCNLSIRLREGRQAWEYKEPSAEVSFNSHKAGFVPSNDKFVITIDLKEGGIVPLIYKGYESPISNPLPKSIHFKVNGIDKFINFTFSPLAYTYKAVCQCLVDSWQYGQSGMDLFQISLSSSKSLSPQATNIRLSETSLNQLRDCFDIRPSDSNNHKWTVSIKKGRAAFNKAIQGIDCKLSFLIDGDKQTCSTTFHVGAEHSNVSTSVRLLRSNQIQVTLSPSDIAAYIDEEKDITLKIKNSGNSEVNITDIQVKQSPQVISFQEKRKQFILQANESKSLHLKAYSSTPVNLKSSVVIKCSENEDVRECIIVNVKPLETPKIKITQLEDSTIFQKLFLGDTLSAKETFSQIKIEYDSIGQGKYLPIKLSDIDFQHPFAIAFEDREQQIPVGGIAVNVIACEDLVLNNDTVDKDKVKNINGKEVVEYNLKFEWKYQKQSGVIEIPITRRKLFRFTPIIENKEITFPRPSESRIHKIMTLKFDSTEASNDIQCWDTNQTLCIEKPFSFDENTDLSCIPIEPETEIQVYLHIDWLEKEANAINIEKAIELPIEFVIKGDNIGPIKRFIKLDGVPYMIKINPIFEKPKPQLSFIHEGTSVRMFKDVDVHANITLPDGLDDAQAIQIGEILVENQSIIPSFKDGQTDIRSGVRRILRPSVSTINDRIDVLHSKTSETLPERIELLNGTDELGHVNHVNFPIYIDYVKWKNDTHCDDLEIIIESNTFSYDNDGKVVLSKETSRYAINITITHLYLDQIYALDLGTTGIVLAKENDGNLECVTLKDVESNPIEESAEILSSHMMMLIPDGNEDGEIKLAPASNEYYSRRDANDRTKRYRLAPSKFIIGQEKIPFLGEFYYNKEINKTLKVFNLVDEHSDKMRIDFSLSDESADNKRHISEFIASLYKSIFDRCSTEVSQIRKLVITYPNTYTIDMLDEIKSIMKERLGLTKEEQVVFVPESDAVAAYFFNQKILDGGFLDDDGIPITEHNVVFYDMGAGTLDLSLVSFITSSNGSITARIINKLGVPLAGNYIDYIIYNTLLEGKFLHEKIKDLPNTIKDLTSVIKRDLKFDDTKIGSNKQWLYDYYQDVFLNPQDIFEMSYKDLFEKSFEKFLETCGNDVFTYLIPKGMKVDTIVFSGRGSQIEPLREKVLSSLRKWCRAGSEIRCETLLDTDNCGDCLKTCVALGALKYQNYFNASPRNDAEEHFRIENRNLYSKIAVVYYGQNKNNGFGVKVKYLLDPQACDWSDAEFRNGTWCKDFSTNVELKNCLSDYFIYFVQTSLDEDSLKSIYSVVYQTKKANVEDLRWAFVNQLYKKRLSGIKTIPVSLTISKENKVLDRQIGDLILTDRTLLENVEQSVLYRRSMWPFITSL